MTRNLEKAIKEAKPVLIKINPHRLCAICRNGTFFQYVDSLEEALVLAELFEEVPVIDDSMVPFTAIIGVGVSGTSSQKGKRLAMPVKQYILHLLQKGGVKAR